MNALALEDRDGTTLLTITLPGLVVRSAAVVPMAVAAVVLHRVAPDAPAWPSLLLVLAAVAAAALPDSATGLVALGGLVAWWLVAVEEPAGWWAFVVACCGLVFHVALAHAAAGPSGCELTRAVAQRSATRCVGVLCLTAGVAAVVDLVERWGEPPSVVVAITLTLVGALPWLYSRRSP